MYSMPDPIYIISPTCFYLNCGESGKYTTMLVTDQNHFKSLKTQYGRGSQLDLDYHFCPN